MQRLEGNAVKEVDAVGRAVVILCEEMEDRQRYGRQLAGHQI